MFVSELRPLLWFSFQFLNKKQPLSVPPSPPILGAPFVHRSFIFSSIPLLFLQSPSYPHFHLHQLFSSPFLHSSTWSCTEITHRHHSQAFPSLLFRNHFCMLSHPPHSDIFFLSPGETATFTQHTEDLGVREESQSLYFCQQTSLLKQIPSMITEEKSMQFNHIWKIVSDEAVGNMIVWQC